MVRRCHRGEVADDRRVSGPQTFQQRTLSVLSCLALIGGLATIGVAAYMVLASYSALPWSDGWVQIVVAAHGENPFSLHWLWQQHNEHRLILTKLLLGADLRLLHANQKLLLASIFAIQALHWLVLAWSMRRLGGWRGPLWRTGAGLSAFCLFCPSQWENLICGFQTCFVLPGLFATLSFVGLLLYWLAGRNQAQRHAWKFLLGSIIAALAASYSLANGSLLWPILIAATWLLKLRRPAVLSYLMTGAISTGLYLHNYTTPLQHANPGVSIRSPLNILKYLAIYFGSSWVRQNIHLAVFFGVVGLLLASAFLLRWRRFAEQDSPLALQLLLTLLFCVGSGILTALGRVNFGYAQAFSSRYQTVALLFWGSLGLLLLSAAAHLPSPARMLMTQGLILAVMVRGATAARVPLRATQEHAFQLRAAAAALITDADDREQLLEVFPAPDLVLSVAPFMRAQHLSIFASRPEFEPGEQFESKFRLAPSDQCFGALQPLETLAGGDSPALRIRGWAWDRKHRAPMSHVVVVAGGKIVGVGAGGDWRAKIRAANPELKTSFVGFTAYAKGIPPSSSMEIYGSVGGEPPQACYVGTIPAAH